MESSEAIWRLVSPLATKRATSCSRGVRAPGLAPVWWLPPTAELAVGVGSSMESAPFAPSDHARNGLAHRRRRPLPRLRERPPPPRTAALRAPDLPASRPP